jgi:hypothetical protein
MKKIWYMFKQMGRMIRARKLYFMAPVLIVLVLLALLVFHLGPAGIMTFIYAGL